MAIYPNRNLPRMDAALAHEAQALGLQGDLQLTGGPTRPSNDHGVFHREALLSEAPSQLNRPPQTWLYFFTDGVGVPESQKGERVQRQRGREIRSSRASSSSSRVKVMAPAFSSI